MGEGWGFSLTFGPAVLMQVEFGGTSRGVADNLYSDA